MARAFRGPTRLILQKAANGKVPRCERRPWGSSQWHQATVEVGQPALCYLGPSPIPPAPPELIGAMKSSSGWPGTGLSRAEEAPRVGSPGWICLAQWAGASSCASDKGSAAYPLLPPASNRATSRSKKPATFNLSSTEVYASLAELSCAHGQTSHAVDISLLYIHVDPNPKLYF